MATTIARAVIWFTQVITAAMVVRAIMSWFVRDTSSAFAGIYRFLINFTEPFILPARKLMGRVNTGMFDFSILIAMLYVEIISQLIVRLILMFAA